MSVSPDSVVEIAALHERLPRVGGLHWLVVV